MKAAKKYLGQIKSQNEKKQIRMYVSCNENEAYFKTNYIFSIRIFRDARYIGHHIGIGP